MSMFCHVCKKRFGDQRRCPVCGAELQLEGRSGLGNHTDSARPHWTRGPAGRVSLSLILSIGAFYALYQILLAGRGGVEDGSPLYQVLFDAAAPQLLQLFTVLVGSLLAGAGERRGLLLGLIVGIFHGLICTFGQRIMGEVVTPIGLLGQPLVSSVIGAAGGALAAAFWPPPLEFHFDGGSGTTAVAPVRKKAKIVSKDVHWVRVLLGTALAVAGVYWGENILDMILDAGRAPTSIRSAWQMKLMNLEIAGLFVLCGGTFAGATTWNGSLQGCVVGILTAAGVTCINIVTGSIPDLITLCLSLASILLFSYLGGYFGALMLPPILKVEVEQPRRFGNWR